MRNYTIALLAILCLLVGKNSYAQDQLKYSNKQIAEMWNTLGVNKSQLTADKASPHHYNLNAKGYPIIAEIDDNNIMTHLGIDIFGTEIKEFQDKLILNFTERYLLELLLESSDLSRKAKMGTDRVTLSQNINSIPTLKGKTGISLSVKSEDEFYLVEWGNSSSNAALTLPADYSFITGHNKIELENEFTFLLKQYKHKDKTTSPNFSSKNITKTGDNLYEYTPNRTIFNNLESKQYLKKDDNQYCYITDKKLPIETLTNIISNPNIENEINLNLTQRKYSFKTERYNCKLQDVIDLCIAQGCTPYVGIESADEDTISATVIMVNHNFHYNHLIYFKMDRTTLSQLSGDCYAEISTYIPTHNVKELFDDNTPTKSTQKIKL